MSNNPRDIDPSQVTRIISQTDPTQDPSTSGGSLKQKLMLGLAIAASVLVIAVVGIAKIKGASSSEEQIDSTGTPLLQKGREGLAGMGEASSHGSSYTSSPSRNSIDTSTEAGKMALIQDQLRQQGLAVMAASKQAGGDPQSQRMQQSPGQPVATAGVPVGKGAAGTTTAAPASSQQPPRPTNQVSSGSGGGGGGYGGPVAPRSMIPADLRKRLDPEYEKWLQWQSSPALVYARAEGNTPSGNNGQVSGIDPSLQNLVAQDGSQNLSGSGSYLPAGTEFRAITNHVIQTDYPSSISATIIAPEQVKGGTIIINYSGYVQERANASLGPMTLMRNGVFKQLQISGVIRTDLPHFTGDVNNHYARRIVPLMVNAGLAGGAIALSNDQGAAQISTKDQIYNNMAVSGVQGVQAEIAKINQGKPELTVTVPAGTEFTIMLTSGIDVAK